MNDYEKVLELLEKKYDWKLYDSLTTHGKKLVKDSLNALSEVKELNKSNVKSSNAFERLHLHWKLIYYYIGGIITGLLLHYCF